MEKKPFGKHTIRMKNVERLSQIVCCSKAILRKNALSKKKRFQDVTTRLTSDKQANNWPTISFETENFPFEKKTSPGQIRTQELCLSSHIFRLSWPVMHKSLNSL